MMMIYYYYYYFNLYSYFWYHKFIIINKLIDDAIKLKHEGLLWHEACGPRNIMASLTFFENESYCLLKSSDSNVIDRHHSHSHQNRMFGTALYSEKKQDIIYLMSKA